MKIKKDRLVLSRKNEEFESYKRDAQRALEEALEENSQLRLKIKNLNISQNLWKNAQIEGQGKNLW